MAERTGMAVQRFSELKYAASQSGVGAEELEGAIGRMQKTLGRIGALDEAAAQLQQIGLNLERLRWISPDEQFKTTADAISRLHTDRPRIGCDGHLRQG